MGRNELEETKTQLEHADRQRRTAEQELSDVMEQVADTTLQNQALQSSKRKLDSEMQTMQADLEEMLTESRIAEEKAKKAMIDAALFKLGACCSCVSELYLIWEASPCIYADCVDALGLVCFCS